MKYYHPRDEYTGRSIPAVIDKKPPIRYNLNILRKLGRGNNGVAYLVEFKGKETILKYQVLKNTAERVRSMKNEHKFYKWYRALSHRDKSFFMDQYDYVIVNENADFIETESLLEYIPGHTLAELVRKKIDSATLRSLYIQILYVINRIQLDGWYHNDMHANNLICREIKKPITLSTTCKFVIEDLQVVLIDYGEASNIKHKEPTVQQIINVVFDIERVYITHFLCFRSYNRNAGFERSITSRLVKFKKKYNKEFNSLISYMRTIYAKTLEERAVHILGAARYKKYKVKEIIRLIIAKAIMHVNERKSANFNTTGAWPLYFIEIFALLQMENAYCNATGIKYPLKLLIPKRDILNLFITIKEKDQTDILCRIINTPA